MSTRRLLFLGVLHAGCIPELRIVHRDAAAEMADVGTIVDTLEAVDASVVEVPPLDVRGDLDEASIADAALDNASIADAAPDNGSAPRDATVEADAAAVPAPRAVAPLSGSVLGTATPTIIWELPLGLREAEVRVCSDATCSRVQQVVRVVGTSTRLATLSSGVWYFQLRGVAGGVVGATSTPAWSFHVRAAATRSNVWSQAADFDNDGDSELVVGAPKYRVGVGRVYTYVRREADGGVTAPTSTLEAPAVGSGSFGASLATAGDVDGDGYVDLVVGAYALGARGAAYLYRGSPDGVSSHPSTTLSNAAAPPNFGWAVAGVGDVNRDGYGDVAVGATGDDGDVGRVSLFLGSSTGLRATPDADISIPMLVDARFGHCLAPLGDIDDDGFDDFAVGAPGFEAATGRAFIVRGRGDVTRIPLPESVRAPAGGSFGHSIANLGDVDGDGRVDLGVGAPGILTKTGWSGAGHAYVFLGGPSGFGATPATTLGTTEVDTAFGLSMSGGADLDGDGRSDIAVGAPSRNGSRGAVYVYESVALTMPTATRTLSGDGADSAAAGQCVAMPGDFTGDGTGDLVISLPGSRSYTGRVQLLPGTRAGATPVGGLDLYGPDGGGGFFGWSIAH